MSAHKVPDFIHRAHTDVGGKRLHFRYGLSGSGATKVAVVDAGFLSAISKAGFEAKKSGKGVQHIADAVKAGIREGHFVDSVVFHPVEPGEEMGQGFDGEARGPDMPERVWLLARRVYGEKRVNRDRFLLEDILGQEEKAAGWENSQLRKELDRANRMLESKSDLFTPGEKKRRKYYWTVRKLIYENELKARGETIG